jgi:hypothetical protein
MLSFHRAICPARSLTDDTYLNNLSLREEQRTLLQEARALVRQALRAAFVQATAAFTNGEGPITPTFFTQGSWSYRTINRPTHTPPQQTDMDDGCYLPMSFVRGTSPKRAASWFFQVADTALRALVKREGWKDYDADKDVCCRVIIDGENHIDVPLYAIRDAQFRMMKSLTEQAGVRFSEAEAASSEDEYPFDWSMVTEEDVLLAQRDGRWKPSNPRIVTNWVVSAIELQREQLRTVWRAIKGWRDHQYPWGGPSSIALMVMVQADFEEIKGRDDLALRAAARSIQAQALSRIEAPWDKREDLNRLTTDERQELVRRAKELEAEIEYCIQGQKSLIPTYLRRLGEQCGEHFSTDVAKVDEVSAHEVVHAYAVTPAAAPRFRGDNRSA